MLKLEDKGIFINFGFSVFFYGFFDFPNSFGFFDSASFSVFFFSFPPSSFHFTPKKFIPSPLKNPKNMTVTNFESSRKIIILCDCCFQEITNNTRIKCECAIDICVTCYFERRPAKNHLPSHKYYAIEPLSFTLIESTWTALEELIFFEMLIQHGLGNWAEIALNLKTKSAQEIENHFYKVFSITNNVEYEDENKIVVLSNPNFHYVNFFAPLRADFDFEDEYEYENSIKFLDVGENETLKTFLLDSYKNLLALRKFKKIVILEKGLTEVKEIKNNIASNNLYANFNNDFYKMAPLAQFISKKDFNLFFGGLSIEKFLLEYKGTNKKVKHDFFEMERLRMNGLLREERDMCKKLRITYSTYLKLKKFALKSYLIDKNVTEKTFSKIVRGSDNRIGILHSFFKRNGWI